jgi:hypothetical protein
MEVHQVLGNTIMDIFRLAMVPEIREKVHKIRTNEQVSLWTRFEKRLKDEYFDEDTKRVTKRVIVIKVINLG